MNSSEQIVQDRENADEQERRRQAIWGGSGGGGGRQQLAIGMGNLGGWVTSAAMIGAVLGGVAGQGFGGAIVGALLFGGSLWLLSKGAKKTGAYHRDARPLVWLLGGACTGAVVGAVLSLAGSDPLWFAVRTWAIFLGGLSGGFCWMARAAARRDVDPDSIKQYNAEWEAKHRARQAPPVQQG